MSPKPPEPALKARVFVDAPLAADASVSLEGRDAHHLLTVLRLKAGDGVTLFNGRDGAWRAEIVEAAKKRATLRPLEQTRAQETEPDIWLLFAPLKKTATDYLVEKATELGASRLIPVATARTETGRINSERLTATARDAACQCERLSLPAIDPLRPLKDALVEIPAERHILAALERADAPLLSAAAKTAPRPHAILIGPEGGFTQAELDLLAKQANVSGVRLGPRILRAETAAVVALSLWQATVGDFT